MSKMNGPVAKERCQFRFKFINAVFRKLNGTLLECKTSLAFVWEPERPKGPFKYYVIKEVCGWGKKMAIFVIYSTVNHQRVGWVGQKKAKT